MKTRGYRTFGGFSSCAALGYGRSLVVATSVPSPAVPDVERKVAPVSSDKAPEKNAELRAVSMIKRQ